jgi:hypothetical protein
MVCLSLRHVDIFSFNVYSDVKQSPKSKPYEHCLVLYELIIAYKSHAGDDDSNTILESLLSYSVSALLISLSILESIVILMILVYLY